MQRDYLDCGDDYLNCGDDYLNCGDDYLNCADDTVSPEPTPVDSPDTVEPFEPTPDTYVPPYQPPRNDNILAEVFYAVIAWLNNVLSKLLRKY
jgi:hypothetical protein